MSIGMPNQIDRSVPQRLPRENLDGVVICVDFHQRLGREQICHRVIFRSDYGVPVPLRVKPATKK
jgi:hypothetical protein